MSGRCCVRAPQSLWEGPAPPTGHGETTPGGCSSISLQSTSQGQLSVIEVLEELLRANLQRNKSLEQKLRVFDLWKTLEGGPAKQRQSALNGKSACGNVSHKQRTGRARDLAAERVGLGDGSGAERALKALRVAEEAERSGDNDLVAKGHQVRQALNDRGLNAATRKVRDLGLLPPAKPRTRKLGPRCTSRAIAAATRTTSTSARVRTDQQPLHRLRGCRALGVALPVARARRSASQEGDQQGADVGATGLALHHHSKPAAVWSRCVRAAVWPAAISSCAACWR
jgi:hypothetical protein